MTTYVLGAPGSGKTTLVPLVRDLLPTYAVIDWDAFMPAASRLAGRAIPSSPSTWPAYRSLVRSVVDALGPRPVVLFGVCTPDELGGWPIDHWLLLDCTDLERRRRLAAADDAAIATALADAAEYRMLGLPVVDSTGLAPAVTAEAIAVRVR